MLVAARKSVLMDALSEALGQVDPNITKKQILTYVPASAQKILATAGIRDEHVFPVPAVLEQKPTLVGYYRLLSGYCKSGSTARAPTWARSKVWRPAGFSIRKTP